VLSERASALRWKNDFARVIAPAMAALQVLPATTALESYLERAKAMDQLAEATFYTAGGKASLAPYRETVALLETAHRLYPTSRLAILRLDRARWALGSTLLALSRIDEALALLEVSSTDLKQRVAFDRDDMEAARLLQIVELDHAEALTDANRVGEGIALMQANIAERRAWLALHPVEPRKLRDLAIGVEQLGDIQTKHGRVGDGCRSYAEFETLVAAMRKIGDFAQMDMADTMDDLAQQERKYCPKAGKAAVRK
jgi:hypothetical protein